MNVHNEPLIIRVALTDEVECYALNFLLQCRFCRRQVEKDELIITVDEIWHIERNAKHVELASKAPELFCPLSHCHEHTPKHASQHCSLLLVIPIDNIIFQYDNEASPILPRLVLSCMFSVHKSTNHESISKWLRRVWWKSLFDLFTQRVIDLVSPIL